MIATLTELDTIHPGTSGIASGFPWWAYRSFVVVGVGEAALAVKLAKACPHLRGGVFDGSYAGPWFDDYVEVHGLRERLRYYPGHVLDDPLPAADVLVMGRVAHGRPPREARRLIEKACAALARDGALIVGLDGAGLAGRRWMARLRAAGFREARVAFLGGAAMAVGIK